LKSFVYAPEQNFDLAFNQNRKLIMHDIGRPIIPGWDAMTLAQRDEARRRQYEQFIVRHPSGETEGRDPRKIPRDELATLAEPMPVLRAIRAKCIDCCYYQISEVARCTAINCPLWPFRMGTNPWRAPASEAQRRSAFKRGPGTENPGNGRGKSEEDDRQVPYLPPDVAGPVGLPDPAIPLAATGLTGAMA
jgi:hypothetical protein